ncbi:YqcC family protein [Muribacter muris]|uniref:YqcC family protein n=1 Tax=Muribacter muris TaxID=67855 RepID=A0A4Y9K4C9_9PAST|nr:YqcC family protein [Muribacter muris]MBF0784250.1 YqcC family protein [Muribacter muris]MBF0827012.1 YqcC family protein [Muribacter muris]TFV12991.1 YqcC family protein [Muribacter muris]
MKTQVGALLGELQIALRVHQLWEETPPPPEKLANTDPFCVNVLTPSQWLQWIFIPRMQAILEAGAELPRNFAITPYLEEALKDEPYLAALHQPLLKLETLLKTE